MIELTNIAVLIDADNTQLSKMEAVLQEISTYGRIVLKRAYGNWKKEGLKNWEDEIKRLAIKAEQQFDYVSGKNATDLALAIETMDLLHQSIYDGFVLVTSDSDYTPLAIRLRESGAFVLGVGSNKTPKSFISTCDEFVYLENLSTTSPETEKEKKDNKPNVVDPCAEIHKLLKIAHKKWQDDDGFVNIGAAGAYLKRAKPDFDPRIYGYSRLTKLIEDFPKIYEVRERTNGNKRIIHYKCK